VTSGGYIFNGATKTACALGEVPSQFNNYTSTINSKMGLVAAETNTALLSIGKHVGEAKAIGDLLSNTGNTGLDAMVKTLVCPKPWDTSTCTDACTAPCTDTGKLFQCPKAATTSYTDACPAAGNTVSVCCFQIPTADLPPLADPSLNYYIPSVAKDAADETTDLGKVPGTIATSVATTKTAISDFDTTFTKAEADTRKQIDTVQNSALSALQGVTNATGGAAMKDMGCGAKEYVARCGV
jgi:hypothetical protein